jgi:predicted secreted protein
VPSNAIPAFGTLLKIGDGAGSETFTTVAEVKSITGPTLSAKIDDVTTHSTTTPWREKLATLLDAGTVSFDLNFIPTNATQSHTSGLLRDFENRTKRNFKLVLPDSGSTTWAITAYIQDFKMAAPVDGVLNASLTLNISGPPTLAG